MNLRVLFYKALNKMCDADITRALYLDTRTFQPPPEDQGVECRVLNADAIDQLVSQADAPVDQVFAHDFRQHRFIGIGAYVNEDLAGLSFYSTGKVESRHNSGGRQFHGIGLELPSHVHYQFKVSVKPAHRGRRLNAAMNACAINFWGVQNVIALVTTTDWTNESFLKSATRQGFHCYGSAAEVVFAGRHLYWLPAPHYPDKPSASKIEGAGNEAIRFVKGSVARDQSVH